MWDGYLICNPNCTWIRSNVKNNFTLWWLPSYTSYAIPYPLWLIGLVILVGQLVLQNPFHPKSKLERYQYTKKTKTFKRVYIIVSSNQASKLTAYSKLVNLTLRFATQKKNGLFLTFKQEWVCPRKHVHRITQAKKELNSNPIREPINQWQQASFPY